MSNIDYGHDVEEKLGRELTSSEIDQIRQQVDQACPQVYTSAEQLQLSLQTA